MVETDYNQMLTDTRHSAEMEKNLRMIADLRERAEIDKKLTRMLLQEGRTWQTEAWFWMTFALDIIPEHPEVRKLISRIEEWNQRMGSDKK